MLNNTWILSHDDESVAAMKNMLTYLISGFDVSSVSLSLLTSIPGVPLVLWVGK